MPRAGLEPARQCDPAQDFKSCASTSFATGASKMAFKKEFKIDVQLPVCQPFRIMTDLPKQLKLAFSLAHQLIREQWLPLLLLVALTAGLGIGLEEALSGLSKNQESERWMLQLAMGLVDLIEGVFLLLLLSWGVPKVRALTEAYFELKPFEEGYIGSFLAEYFRALASVLLYGLLFLLPGFYRYLRLIFVPYITLFAKPYREGKVDALKLSFALTQGRMWRLLVVLIVTILVQLGIEFAPQMELLHLWPVRVVAEVLNSYLSIWLFAFLYMEFEEALGRYPETQTWT